MGGWSLGEKNWDLEGGGNDKGESRKEGKMNLNGWGGGVGWSKCTIFIPDELCVGSLVDIQYSLMLLAQHNFHRATTRQCAIFTAAQF